jgi:hypothetical protein
MRSRSEKVRPTGAQGGRIAGAAVDQVAGHGVAPRVVRASGSSRRELPPVSAAAA